VYGQITGDRALLSNSNPIAPTARNVRVVNLERGSTERWRVEADGVPACELRLAVNLDNTRGEYRILAPTIDRAAGYLTPHFLSDGTFDRGSRWWIVDVLHDVLGMLVRACIAPGAADITIADEGTPKATEPDASDTCFALLRLALATLGREIRRRPRDNTHAITAYALVTGALAVLDADDPPLPGSTRRPLPPPPWWRA
jgi:hypothetical protein